MKIRTLRSWLTVLLFCGSCAQASAQTCTYALGTTTLSPGSSADATNVLVLAPAGCAWAATSNASWLSVNPASGIGNGGITVSWTVNGTGAPRIGVITVEGASLTVTQDPHSTRPTNLVVMSVTGNTVALSWMEPAAGTPSQYVMEGGILPGQVLARAATGSAATLFVFDAPTGVFYVRVHAMLGGTRSEASNEIRLVVNVPEPPSAPLYLLGLVNGSSLALSWRNTFYGGEPTGIRLYVEGAITTTLTLPLTESISFSGVPAGTYMFSVAAVNGVGVGPLSNRVTLTFPQTCASVPAAPTNLTIFKDGYGVWIAWDPPSSGAAVTEYLVTVTGSVAGTVPTTRRFLAATVPGGSYNIRVAASNACGTGASTPPQTITVP